MRRLTAALLACVVFGTLAVTPTRGDAGAVAGNPSQPGAIVSASPSSFTPNIMNGTVLTMAKVGNWIVVGGTFTLVRNAGSTQNIARRNVFAFDSVTGRVSDTFAPNPNRAVFKVLPTMDGKSVYLGGSFTKITSSKQVVASSRLAKLSVTTGNRVSGFRPGSINGTVRDMELTGNRLWVAGKFTLLHGRKQRALGTINARTGAYDRYFTGIFSGLHRPQLKGSKTSVLAISVSRTGRELVAVGNFKRVNGSARSQIAKFGLSAKKYTLSNWRTRLYESACSKRFESYVTDVSYSPNGSYFVVSTTGGYGGATASLSGRSGCDVVARFEAKRSGRSIAPTWTAYTGGDTTWTVEVTQDVIYAGGHQRWQNNPTRGNSTGQGAV